MIYIVLGSIGAVMGSIFLYGYGGWLPGGMIGLLAASAVNQRRRFLALEKRLTNLESRMAAPSSAQASPEAADTPGASPAAPAGADEKEKDIQPPPAPDGAGDATVPIPPEPWPDTDAAIPSLELELSDGAIAGGTPPESPGRPTAPPTDTLEAPIREFLLGGNLVVRVGVVVLLFGFAFLVKYAADRGLVPLDIRLTAAFAAGIGLLLLGWNLRDRRFAYAVALQGGGIGVMYLTVFAAARLFHLVPLPLTFAVMVSLVGFSGLLAVLQDAAAMAVLGAAGGFMAPVLLSTGSGSHVMLFSYYALLNAGIFGIAWFKSWRWLNLLGFLFTFGIGSAWGLRYYRPAYLATTEPFLVLFFAFYLSIAVLFAWQQTSRLIGYVDGSLVFGLPLAAFGLQVGLVKNIPYGLAFSAVVLGLIYTGLATGLWQRRGHGLADLVEAFLALGVVFGSLAVPLALSGNWTAVAWSLEGAGLVWLGIRQDRWTARSFGVLLQIGSGAAFLLGVPGGASGMAVFNNRFLGGMIVGTAGLFSAFLLERHRDRLHRPERLLSAPMMAWGLGWWFGAGLNEIARDLSRRHELAAAAAYIGLSGLAMGFGYRRFSWKGLRRPAAGLLPVMFLCAFLLVHRFDFRHPFQDWWIWVWPLLFAVHLYLLQCMGEQWNQCITVGWHVLGALLAVALLSGEAAWLLNRVAGGTRVWPFVAWGGLPAGVLMALVRFRKRLGWPVDAWPAAYRDWLPSLMVLGLLIWSLRAMTMDGDARPLPYLPLLNPLDLVQFFVLLAIIRWVLDNRGTPTGPAAHFSPGELWTAPAGVAFLWLTAVVARSVHHLAGVPYSAAAMFGSGLFHAAVAVLWGLLALGCMAASRRLLQRPAWFTGAGLLAVVVVKLFLIDLSGAGTVSRIVSFLAVGGLMLVIGYFTPLPPAESKGGRP